MPPIASLASNLTFPKGLQTTTQRSQEIMAKDQRAVIPVGNEAEGIDIINREQHRSRVDIYTMNTRGVNPSSKLILLYLGWLIFFSC